MESRIRIYVSNRKVNLKRINIPFFKSKIKVSVSVKFLWRAFFERTLFFNLEL